MQGLSGMDEGGQEEDPMMTLYRANLNHPFWEEDMPCILLSPPSFRYPLLLLLLQLLLTTTKFLRSTRQLRTIVQRGKCSE